MHIIHGELRKAPYIKPGCGQDGQSTMFIIELSEMIKDRQTGEKNYTNYSAAIFAKSQAQIDYYHTSLVEGNFVVVNCEKLKIDVNESNGKQYIKLQMEGARLEGAKYIEGNQQQGGFQQQAPQQGGFTPQHQQQHQQQHQGSWNQQSYQQQGNGQQQGDGQ
jgi:single-strand DNA-binding protein